MSSVRIKIGVKFPAGSRSTTSGAHLGTSGETKTENKIENKVRLRVGGAGESSAAPAAIPVPKTLPKISGTYTNNCDIHHVHRQMLSVFAYWKAEVPQLQDQLKALQKRLATVRMSPISEGALRREIKQLEDTISQQSSDERRDAYVRAVEPWLKEYAELQQTNKTSLFGKRAQLSEAEQARCLSVIASYLFEANRYYRVDIVRDQRKEFLCYCGRPESELDIDADGAYYCTCGYTREAEICEADDSLPTASASTGSTNSKDRENFIDAMANYQAKNQPPRYASIVAALDEHFEGKKLTTADVLKLPRDAQGRPVGTDRDLMHRALSQTDSAHGYKFINYILRHYWDWPLEDISHLEQKLLDDYELFQPVYESIKDESGSIASFNVQYRLCRHLQRAGYPCYAIDFKIPQDSAFRRLEKQWNMCHRQLFGKDAPPLR